MTDPMDDVDCWCANTDCWCTDTECWCTDTDRELNITQDYCPRHGTEPDWNLVDEGTREQQKATRREHGTPWNEG